MAVFAPMPAPIIATTVRAKIGLVRNERNA